MASLIVILCLIAPPLAMWWMVVVQRRVRAQMRARREEEGRLRPGIGYVEEERGADGFSYGRRSEIGEALPPPSGIHEEVDGVRALQGRR